MYRARASAGLGTLGGSELGSGGDLVGDSQRRDRGRGGGRRKGQEGTHSASWPFMGSTVGNPEFQPTREGQRKSQQRKGRDTYKRKGGGQPHRLLWRGWGRGGRSGQVGGHRQPPVIAFWGVPEARRDCSGRQAADALLMGEQWVLSAGLLLD